MVKKSFLGSLLSNAAKAADKAIKAAAQERKRQENERKRQQRELQKQIAQMEKDRIRIEKEAEKSRIKLEKQLTMKVKKKKDNILSQTHKEHSLYRPIMQGNGTIIASEIPVTCDMGNMINNKDYDSAIKIGNELLAKPSDSEFLKMIHINLMVAYFKAREIKTEYLELSTYHAKQAILNGHNTGLAQERLLINLEKSRKIHQAIQLCDLVLSPQFKFSKHGCKTKSDFRDKKRKLQEKRSKACDSPNDILFSDIEENTIFRNSKNE